MAERYTTISSKQVRLLYILNSQGKLQISKNMLDYLYAIARQGPVYARDPAVEDFRRSISKCVGILIKNRCYNETNQPGLYKQVNEEVRRAFKQICAVRANKYLEKVKADLENPYLERERRNQEKKNKEEEERKKKAQSAALESHSPDK